MTSLDDVKNYMEMLKRYGLESFVSSEDSLEILDHEIRNCKVCKNRSFAFIPEYYPEDVKVLFILSHPENIHEEKILFRDERVLFSNILKAMNLKVSDIFILPAMRCNIEGGIQSADSDLKTCECKIFFDRAIVLLKSRIICFMGEDTRKICDEFKLTEHQTPVYFTFSPSEMIKNPSLKKEAWQIFQDIMKKLQEDL